MAKRFSEIDKWKDEWFSSLSPVQKLTFLFLCDNCDNAGFIDLNPRINSFLIGISEEEYIGAVKGLNRGLLGAKNSTLYWIKNFLFHQKNLPLNPDNNAHKQIINLIRQNLSLFEIDFNEELGAEEGLLSPTGRGKGKGKEEGGAGEGTKKRSLPPGKFQPPTLDEVKAYFRENGFREEVGERAWKGYDAAKWHDSNGKPVKNWKQKCQNVWFRDEHKALAEKSAAPAPVPASTVFNVD